jgi:hypothetical protein
MRRAHLAAIATALVAVTVSTGVMAAPIAQGQTTAGDRVETPVDSTSPIKTVAESMVSVRIPLPGAVGAHPEACDWVSYLRWRHVDGPTDSTQADRVLVAQPGIFEGAGAFDSVARSTIVNAAQQGAQVEFWALDRRSNCLEDNTGRMAGVAAKDHHVAVDYYYRNATINGRRFAGFLGNDQVGWLSKVGMAQTLRDQYDLIRHELPDPVQRRQKTFCGGHSLGGSITGYFAIWDFDGDAATTEDAGYNQCAGYFALDSVIHPGLPNGGGDQLIPGDGVPDAPVLSLPAVINPETMSLLGISGLAALANPATESDLLDYLPENDNINTTMKVLFSKDLINFITGSPSPRDFRFTNEAAMAALLDNNSQPLAFLQTALGFFDGGPIADKDFPLPNDVADIPILADLVNMFGPDPKGIPTDTGQTPGTGPVYTWRNYDRIGAPDDPGYRTRNGELFATPDQEITDAMQLARSLAEAPLDFTEWYFPAKLADDSNAPDEEMKRHALHSGGIAARPVITLLAGSGVSFLPPEEIQPPPVIAPGYHHLDVLTAAPRQNGDRPELVSLNLARFVTSH